MGGETPTLTYQLTQHGFNVSIALSCKSWDAVVGRAPLWGSWARGPSLAALIPAGDPASHILPASPSSSVTRRSPLPGQVITVCVRALCRE